MNNRILLSSPCFDKVAPEILEDWMAFAFYCGRFMPEYEFCLGIKTKTEQFRARNAIVEAAQQHDCDWILMMDDDMVIDWAKKGRESYSFIRQLISHDKDICGILYYQRGQECNPVLMRQMDEKRHRFLRDDEIEYKLQEVDVAGGGCWLLKTRIFDRIGFPLFGPEHQYGTDLQLCMQAKKKGFKIYADTSIELGHMRNEKTIVTSRNRHLFQDQASAPGVKRTFVASDLYENLIQDVMEYTGKPTREAVINAGEAAFLELSRDPTLSDADFYRLHPVGRICRQVWFNTKKNWKKDCTQFVLSMIPPNQPRRILDFGCGIGITAFALAEKGHQVTAMDIRGTGTLEFLKWRCQKHNVPMTFIESEGGIPQLSGMYDEIIAMDCLEHIKEWRETLTVLSEHLMDSGRLFNDNAIFYNNVHPEHYDLHPRELVKLCADLDLMPQTSLNYVKASQVFAQQEEVNAHA